MEWVEVTGKTLEEAKDLALDQLGVAEGDAEVLVLSEPKTGLFGRVRSEARVRARVRPVGPRPKRTRRPRDKERTGEATPRSGGSAARSGRNVAAKGGSGGVRAAANGAGPAGPVLDDDEGPEETEVGAPGNGSGTGRSRSARRRRSRTRSGPAGQSGNGDEGSTHASGNESRTKSSIDEETEMADGMTLQEQATVAQDFLQGLLEAYGLDASVEIRELDEDTVELAATGSDLGVLVGPAAVPPWRRCKT